MNGQIMPTAKVVDGNDVFLGIYVPGDGAYIIAKKTTTGGSTVFSYSRTTDAATYAQRWANRSSIAFDAVVEGTANLNVLLNQLLDTSGAAPATSSNVTVLNTALPVTGTFYQATQPVSAAALPLPTGAATSALQATVNTNTAALTTSPLLAPKTTGGLSSKACVVNAATATPTLVKAGPAQLYALDLANVSAATVFVSVFDKATAPAAGDIPKLIYAVPAGQTFRTNYPLGSAFALGLGLTITSNITLAGTLTALLTPNQVVANVHYA